MKTLAEQLDPLIPSKEEMDFSKSLEGQLMEHLKESVKKKRYIESAILIWANIEQVRLPMLIKFVSDNLKIAIQKMKFKS